MGRKYPNSEGNTQENNKDRFLGYLSTRENDSIRQEITNNDISTGNVPISVPTSQNSEESEMTKAEQLAKYKEKQAESLRKSGEAKGKEWGGITSI